MTLLSEFSKAFDPSNKEHVEWLVKCTSKSEDISPDLLQQWKDNPFGIAIKDSKDFLETAEIYFFVMSKYAKAVFKNEAYIPPAQPQET